MQRPPPRTARGVTRSIVLVAAVALSLFTCCQPAMALQPTVVDGADILLPETVDKANATIRQIKQTFHKDVMIETYAAVPKEMEADLQKKGKEQFYVEWVVSRAQALGVDGLFILIVKSSELAPGRLQIEVGRKTRQKAFTLADRADLRETMVKSFQNKQFDRGVLDGLEFIVRRMERNTGIPAGNRPNLGHPQAGTAGTGAAGTGAAGTGTSGAGAAPVPTPTTVPASPPVPTPATPATAPAGPTTVPAVAPAPTTGPTTAPTTAPVPGDGDF